MVCSVNSYQSINAVFLNYRIYIAFSNLLQGSLYSGLHKFIFMINFLTKGNLSSHDALKYSVLTFKMCFKWELLHNFTIFLTDWTGHILQFGISGMNLVIMLPSVSLWFLVSSSTNLQIYKTFAFGCKCFFCHKLNSFNSLFGKIATNIPLHFVLEGSDIHFRIQVG